MDGFVQNKGYIQPVQNALGKAQILPPRNVQSNRRNKTQLTIQVRYDQCIREGCSSAAVGSEHGGIIKQLEEIQEEFLEEVASYSFNNNNFLSMLYLFSLPTCHKPGLSCS